MGGAHPNHFISVYEKTKEEVLSILEDDNMVMAEEIKISVVGLQRVHIGFFPYGISCGRPQTKNEAKNFNNKIVEVCKKYSNTHPGSSHTIFSVDGVSADSKCVWTSICNFIGEKFLLRGREAS